MCNYQEAYARAVHALNYKRANAELEIRIHKCVYRHNVHTLSVLHGHFQILFRHFQIM
jgi:hypothetical protein